MCERCYVMHVVSHIGWLSDEGGELICRNVLDEALHEAWSRGDGEVLECGIRHCTRVGREVMVRHCRMVCEAGLV